VLIGPPGAGKTMALKHSGLGFPLAEHYGHEALRGVGGTRDCDWWFTDEAVLLDTAGRYLTQDSDESVDSSAWGEFLKLLRRYRRRRPINGIIVAISLADILDPDPATQERHARSIRRRIREIDETLGLRFPVYVMLTKADLVAGFTEFFETLDTAQRNQVWGLSFEAAGNDPQAKKDIEDLQRQMQNLDPRRFPGNPEMVEHMSAEVLAQADKLELRLRQNGALDQGQVRSPKPKSAAPAYQDAVADYYRRLSKTPQ